jgi:RNA polymerase sigma-70 factor (ECF subfamily)
MWTTPLRDAVQPTTAAAFIKSTRKIGMFRTAPALERNPGAGNWRTAHTLAGSPLNVRRFETVAQPHLDAAYNLARWLTGNDDDAQTITQQSALRAFHLLIQFPPADARAWLLSIVHDTYYTWLNETGDPAHDEPYAEKHNDRVGEDSALPGNLPAFVTDRRETNQTSKEFINQALNGLPVTFREIIVLRELEDLSYWQIAQIVDISVNDVMALLVRARELLRAQLFQIGAQPSS